MRTGLSLFLYSTLQVSRTGINLHLAVEGADFIVDGANASRLVED